MTRNISKLQPASNPDPQHYTARDTAACVQDNEYYFDFVVFRVGNTIFRVPKNGFLVPGTIFETMFSLPASGENMEGSKDQNPIVLPVNEEHFRGFLRAMYPFNGLHLGTDDWLGALDLSTMWMFDEIRNRAIQALQPWSTNQSAKEVILLAKKYHILNWLKDGYIRLLQQSDLTAAELSAEPPLDWQTIAKILSVKLAATNANYSRARGGYSNYGQVDWASLIDGEFIKEFSDINVSLTHPQWS